MPEVRPYLHFHMQSSDGCVSHDNQLHVYKTLQRSILYARTICLHTTPYVQVSRTLLRVRSYDGLLFCPNTKERSNPPQRGPGWGDNAAFERNL
jgi:hypothetical protein